MAGFPETRDRVSIKFIGCTAPINCNTLLATVSGTPPSGEDPQSSRPCQSQNCHDQETAMEWESSDETSNVAPPDDEIPMETD